MLHNATTQAKETPSQKNARMLETAKAKLDEMAAKATADNSYFGRPSVEMVVQGGKIETVVVNNSCTIR